MKVNPIMAVVAFLVAALAGYGFYAGNAAEEFALFLAIGGGVSIFLTLGTLLAVGVKSDARLGVGIKAVAAIFLAVLLAEQLIFAFAPMRAAPYIIVTGILWLLYFVICYAIGKSGD